MSEPPLRPGEINVTWRYDLYRNGEAEPFHSDYNREPEILAIQLQVSLTNPDVDRIEIVRCPTVAAS